MYTVNVMVGITRSKVICLIDVHCFFNYMCLTCCNQVFFTRETCVQPGLGVKRMSWKHVFRNVQKKSGLKNDCFFLVSWAVHICYAPIRDALADSDPNDS